MSSQNPLKSPELMQPSERFAFVQACALTQSQGLLMAYEHLGGELDEVYQDKHGRLITPGQALALREKKAAVFCLLGLGVKPDKILIGALNSGNKDWAKALKTTFPDAYERCLIDQPYPQKQLKSKYKHHDMLDPLLAYQLLQEAARYGNSAFVIRYGCKAYINDPSSFIQTAASHQHITMLPRLINQCKNPIATYLEAWRASTKWMKTAEDRRLWFTKVPPLNKTCIATLKKQYPCCFKYIKPAQAIRFFMQFYQLDFKQATCLQRHFGVLLGLMQMMRCKDAKLSKVCWLLIAKTLTKQEPFFIDAILKKYQHNYARAQIAMNLRMLLPDLWCYPERALTFYRQLMFTHDITKLIQSEARQVSPITAYGKFIKSLPCPAAEASNAPGA